MKPYEAPVAAPWGGGDIIPRRSRMKDTRDQRILDVRVPPAAIVAYGHQRLRADLMLFSSLFAILRPNPMF